MSYQEAVMLAMKLRRRGLSYPAISSVFAELYPEWTFSEGWFRDQLRGKVPPHPRGIPFGKVDARRRMAA